MFSTETFSPNIFIPRLAESLEAEPMDMKGHPTCKLILYISLHILKPDTPSQMVLSTPFHNEGRQATVKSKDLQSNEAEHIITDLTKTMTEAINSTNRTQYTEKNTEEELQKTVKKQNIMKEIFEIVMSTKGILQT